MYIEYTECQKNVHKEFTGELWKNYSHFMEHVEKNRNIKHFLNGNGKKIVKSVHNFGSECYNKIIITEQQEVIRW